MVHDEIDELRDDLDVLRVMMDAALDRRAEHSTLKAIAGMIHDRRERLEQLERLADVQAQRSN